MCIRDRVGIARPLYSYRVVSIKNMKFIESLAHKYEHVSAATWERAATTRLILESYFWEGVSLQSLLLIKASPLTMTTIFLSRISSATVF